jgi:hypothetical protein
MFPAPEYNIGAPDGAQCNNKALVYCTSREVAIELRPEARYERLLTAPNARTTGYAYDNPCYAPAVTDVSTCTYSSGGRTYTFDQNGGKRSQAMIAVDAIFHF